MDIITFSQKLNQAEFVFAQPVTWFLCTKEYPLLFASFLIDRIKKIEGVRLEVIDCASEDYASVMARLQTSFLGQRTAYWLGNVSALSEKKKKQLVEQLKKHTGSNSVFACTVAVRATTKKPLAHEIVVPQVLDRKQFQVLLHEALVPSARAQSIVKIIFARTKTVPLETAVLLVRYSTLVGRSMQEFVDQWLDKLVVPETSLFTLSQYFFAKDARNFFALWSRVGQTYPEQFWIAFWSEQLWRAYHVVQFNKVRQFAQAKKIAFRLPFSLIQRDWQKLKCKELSNAHSFVYEFDHRMKNSGSPQFLELLYTEFFAGNFNHPR